MNIFSVSSGAVGTGYFNQLSSIISLYYNINEIKNIINSNEEVPKNIIDDFKSNINNIGVFAIKLIQWSISRLKLISNKKNLHKFLENLENYYDNCPIHDIKYTEELFKKDFNENIYANLEIEKDNIFSGSIGQVYKGKLFNENKIVAINVLIQISIVKLFYQDLFLIYLIII